MIDDGYDDLDDERDDLYGEEQVFGVARRLFVDRWMRMLAEKKLFVFRVGVHLYASDSHWAVDAELARPLFEWWNLELKVGEYEVSCDRFAPTGKEVPPGHIFQHHLEDEAVTLEPMKLRGHQVHVHLYLDRDLSVFVRPDGEPVFVNTAYLEFVEPLGFILPAAPPNVDFGISPRLTLSQPAGDANQPVIVRSQGRQPALVMPVRLSGIEKTEDER